jgi:hypothetical protein
MCLDVSWHYGIVVERCPDLPDAKVESVLEIYEGPAPPDFCLQLFAGDHLPRSRNQDREHAHGLRTQPDLPTSLLQFTRLLVEFERTEPELRGI